MTEEMKPCPFCGGEAEVHDYAQMLWMVKCPNCPAVQQTGNTAQEAIDAWNRRISNECI